MYTLILTLEGLAGAALLLAISAYSANMDQGNALATVIVTIFVIFDPNFIAQSQIPVYWRWFKNVSFISYATQAAMVVVFRGLKFKCTDEERQTSTCFYETGEEVLKQRNINGTNVWFSILMLILLQLVYRIIAFIGVWLMHRGDSPLIVVKKTFGLL